MDMLLTCCAENAIIDSATGKISILNLVEELTGVGYPGIIPNLCLVMYAMRSKGEPENHQLRIVAAHEKKILFDLPYSISFQGKVRLRGIARLSGMPVTGPGTIIIAIKDKKGKVLGEWPMTALDANPPQIAPPAPKLGTATDVKSKKAPKRRGRRVSAKLKKTSRR